MPVHCLTTWHNDSACQLRRVWGDIVDAAWRCINEAITVVETTKARWCEAEVHRVAGEIALRSPERDAVKAEAYFERALAVARRQQAKSWELRAAMSIARLWRDQGKLDQACDLGPSIRGNRIASLVVGCLQSVQISSVQ
jgi:hypothetical protein